ncbi:hypothetical protein SAMN05216247_11017 [Pseudomonas salomonii]|uniref:Uncharacterized protein n=1 Tax=Pseudomonas salomonii TaxID=191391 RepID=A0A1H3SVZ7_9PSED|nr:hypothetical protein [Pseudomonas sp. 58 R 3]SDZ41920.1 hypothetical protein SAMN05216247_11017 [Pseudomonas salomonii]
MLLYSSKDKVVTMLTTLEQLETLYGLPHEVRSTLY